MIDIKNKKIVFFDIDGTIFNQETNKIPRSTIYALKQLSLDSDIEVAIATGRPFSMLNCIEELFDFIDIFILLNGNIIIYKGEIIFRKSIKDEDVLRIVSLLRNNSIIYGFYGEKENALSTMTKEIDYAFKKYNIKTPIINPDFHINNNVYLMFAIGDVSIIRNIFKDIIDFKVVSWISDGADIMSILSSKAEGIKFVINKFGFCNSNTYAFGDADNDIEMIKLCNIGVAMGNATQSVKSVSNYITTNVDDNGIYNALVHFKLII